MLKLLYFAVLACASATLLDLYEESLFRDLSDLCRKTLMNDEIYYIPNKFGIYQYKGKVSKTEADLCFLTCIYTKMGYLKDEKLNYKGIIDVYKYMYGNDEKKMMEAKKLYEICQPIVDKQSNTKCARGFVYGACAFNTINRLPPIPENCSMK